MHPAVRPALFIDAHPSEAAVLQDVLQGLSLDPKRLPAKLFYDAEGSRLFEQICDLDEYYPTRTEVAIMESHIGEMADVIGPGASVLELGSGSSTKTEILLSGLHHPVSYLPLDISGEHLLASSERIAARHPALEVLPVCADYTQYAPQLEAYARRHRLVVFFPGSTIGNFDPVHAGEFLKSIANLVGPGGGLLIGVDLKKDPAVLRAAYNDRQGVTGAFNLNMLSHINSRLGDVFDVAAFEHEATWNAEMGRIEMRLRATTLQEIQVGARTFTVPAGESIVTEHCYKYSLDGFAQSADASGFSTARVWIDSARLFSVHYLVAS